MEAGDEWGVLSRMMLEHKLAVLLTFPLWPADGAVALNIVSSGESQAGRKETGEKGLSLLLRSPKQEEILKLPADVLGQNLITWPSLD